MLSRLPTELLAYKKISNFTEDSIPNALLKDHNTQKDVWAKIIVLKGSLLYTIKYEAGDEENLLEAGQVGIVVPEQMHFVKANKGLEFYVEFYR